MAGNSNPIRSLVERLGGQSALARLLGTKQSTVWEWVKEGRVPSARILTIMEVAGNLDPPVTLRTDDFFDVGSIGRGA